MPEGIRKINEHVVQLGRTLVVNDSKLDFSNFFSGTPYIDSTGNLKVKKDGQTDWVNFTPANIFVNKAITYNFIADKTLTNQQIADGTILNKNIKDLEINTNKIANNAITTDKILNLNVTNDKIANNAIKNEKLFDKTIQGNKIADDVIDYTHLKADSVRNVHIQNNAVTTSKILDRNITSNKIALLNVKTEHYADASITTPKIADLQITTAKIGNLQVTTGKIGNSQVTSEKIANNAITTAKIDSLQVTGAKIANLTIGTDKLADNVIATKKIQNNAVTAEKLARTVNDAINSAIKLDSTGVANVNGSLYVKNNITASGTITANKIYNAVYNDLAEGYVPGEKLVPGTVVEVRDDGKVYKAHVFSDAIVGVISDEYAECYGASEQEIESGEKVAVGLIGKVHVLVNGPVNAGQRIVSIGDGIAGATVGTNCFGIVGKALETVKDCGLNKVLCLIYPN